MDYKTAQLFKNKSLSSLITNKIVSGENIGTSIKKSISEKLQAKATRTKEKFDPLNIAKFLTGGGNLAPAILGKLTGRSQKDIKYFSGGGQDTAKKLVKMNTETIGSLSEIFAFIKKNHEKDLEMQETERSFREEKQNEEQRRHDEFLKVLKNFISGKESSPTAEQAEEENIFSKIFGWVKKMISDAIKYVIETIQNMFSWINELRLLNKIIKFVPMLATFLASPAGLALLTVTTILGLAELFSRLVKLMPDYSKIKNPRDAISILKNATSEEDIKKFPGGRKALEEAIGIGQISKEDAKYALENLDLNEGEREQYQFILDYKGDKISLPPVPPRPDTTGGINKARAAQWDAKFGETHNPDGSPKDDPGNVLQRPILQPTQTSSIVQDAARVGTSLAEVGQNNTLYVKKQTRRPDVVRFVESGASDSELLEQVGADRKTLTQWLNENPTPTAVFDPRKIQEEKMGVRKETFRRQEIERQNVQMGDGADRSLGTAGASGPNSTASPVSGTADTPGPNSTASLVSGTADTPVVSGATRSMASPVSVQSPVATPVNAEMVSVSSAPHSADVYNMSNENYNLALNDLYQEPPAPIVKNSVNNSSTQENFSVAASLRDSTVIMSRVIKQSSAYV